MPRTTRGEAETDDHLQPPYLNRQSLLHPSGIVGPVVGSRSVVGPGSHTSPASGSVTPSPQYDLGETHVRKAARGYQGASRRPATPEQSRATLAVKWSVAGCGAR